jgi:uncharacterized protein (TIGR02271 family)
MKPLPNAEPSSAPALPQNEETVIPVAVEELALGKQLIERERVRVLTRTEVHDVDLDAVRKRDDVRIERVLVGREIATPPQVRVEGDTTIIPVVEEVVIVERRLVLREEIRITKRNIEQRERRRLSLRRQRAEVVRTEEVRPITDEETRPNERGEEPVP